MKKWFFPFLLILVLVFPSPVEAQGTVTFATLEIDLWPEYDRPEMLVIYRIELSSDVSIPVELSIRIPAAAGEPNAIAVRDLNGNLLNAPYERSVQGDWALITLTATTPSIQLEYYDPQLVKEGSQRNYEFFWMGDYNTESLIVQLQQPIDSSQVVISPVAGSVALNPDGLSYHTIDLGTQSAGETVNVSISYSKDSDALTVERFPVQPSVPISDSTSGRSSAKDLLPWGLGLLALILVFGGVWWYWRLGKEKPKTRKRSRGRRPARIQRFPSGNGEDMDDAIYCHQCGKRARSGDRFCRACGTKLKGV
jgi:hypothetical protein